MFRLLIAGLTAGAATAKKTDLGNCGDDWVKKSADCQNVDYGSCGNACCKLDVRVWDTNILTVDDVVNKLNQTLAYGIGPAKHWPGGPDGWYELQKTVFGTLGFYDLRQNGSPFGKEFIGQVLHTTSGPGHYTDTINFNIASNVDATSTAPPSFTIRAFSISQIAGALGDSGQNYKNIIYPLNVAFGYGFEVTPVDGSCGGAVKCTGILEHGLCPPGLTVNV